MNRYKTNLKDLSLGLAILAVYFIAGKLGLSLAFVNQSTSAVWPPTGIALAAFLIFGLRFWPAVFLGAFLVNFTTSDHLTSSIFIALGNTLESLVGAFLVKRLTAGLKAFDIPNNILKFVFFAGMLAPLISATIGVISLVVSGLASASQSLTIWTTWWIGDVAGAVIVAPFVIIWSAGGRFKWSKIQFLEAFIYAVIFFIISAFVFGPLSDWGRSNYPLAFVILPMLMWVASRFGKRESVTVVVIFSAFIIWATLNGYGPFYRISQNVSLLLLQSFMITMSVTTLAIAALIAQRKELEQDLIGYAEQLAESSTKAEALLASLGEGIVATDQQGKIILVNKTFEDLLGLKAAEVLGKTTANVVAMEDEKGWKIPEKQRPLYLAFSLGQKITASHYLVKKDGSKFMAAITATPLIIDGNIIGGVKIFRDITVESQIDKAKTEFVSLASHQLRTPLTTVKWHSSRLLEKWDDPNFTSEQREKSVREIYYTNQRMVELVNAILNVSKIDLGNLAVEPEEVNVPEIANGVLEDLSLQIQNKELLFSKEYQPGLPTILADPKLLRIVFQNLLTNSIKYTPEKGRIACRITKEGQNLLIEVQDSGCGIPPEDSAKIFSKFFRTETARKIDPNGNGLGMYIVKAIVEQAEGKVWFKSEVSKGTTFYVILPISGMKKKPGAKDLIESYS